MHHCLKILMGNSRTTIKSSNLELSTMVRRFPSRTLDCGATKMVQKTWRGYSMHHCLKILMGNSRTTLRTEKKID